MSNRALVDLGSRKEYNIHNGYIVVDQLKQNYLVLLYACLSCLDYGLHLFNLLASINKER